MNSPKAVVPKLFQFQVPNSKTEAISEVPDSYKKVISGVLITNKIPAKKQVLAKAKKPEKLETSFMIKNGKREEIEVAVMDEGVEVEEQSLEEGFPYDAQAEVLFGQPTHSSSTRVSLVSPQPPVSIPSKISKSDKSRPVPKPSTVLESEALARVKAQAREKVRSWLQAAEEKRARQLQGEKIALKKCDLNRAGGRVSTELKILVSAGVKNRKVTQKTIEGMKNLCEIARKESDIDARNQAETHLRRVYSALPKTEFQPKRLLHDPDKEKMGLKQLQPVVIDFLYEEKTIEHPWIPKEMQGKGENQSSSESSFEEVGEEA